MIWKSMFSAVWPGRLKWIETGVSLFTQVSQVCLAIVYLNSHFVSPTYCFLHDLHMIR